MAVKKFKVNSTIKTTGIEKAIKKVYRNTEIRKKQVKRIKGIVKRLEKAGYDVDIDISSLSTQKIKSLDRKKLIWHGYAKIDMDEYIENIHKKHERKRKEREKKRQENKKRKEKVVSMKEARKYDPSAPHWGIVLSASDAATAIIDNIIKILEKGGDYTGGHSKKRKGKSGFVAVNQSAGRIHLMFEDARNKRTDKDILNDILAKYGSVSAIQERIERLIGALYDPIYAKWADGSAVYEAHMTELAKTIGGKDFGF